MLAGRVSSRGRFPYSIACGACRRMAASPGSHAPADGRSVGDRERRTESRPGSDGDQVDDDRGSNRRAVAQNAGNDWRRASARQRSTSAHPAGDVARSRIKPRRRQSGAQRPQCRDQPSGRGDWTSLCRGPRSGGRRRSTLRLTFASTLRDHVTPDGAGRADDASHAISRQSGQRRHLTSAVSSFA